MKHPGTVVYFIRPVGRCGPIKIGCSKLPAERLKTIMVWSPFPLEIAATAPGNHILERRLHGMFKASHSHWEWFDATPALIKLVERVAAGTPLSELVDLSSPILPFREITAEQRRLRSYSARIRHAFGRVEGERRYPPREVAQILHDWRGWRTPRIEPTAKQLKWLEQLIADPEAHAVTADEHWADESEAMAS